MKTNYLISILVVSICFVNQIFAHHETQLKNSDVEGLFITPNEFKMNKLTKPTDMQHNGDRIKLKQFFFSSEIVSVEQSKETVFFKDSIFAVRTKDGKNYRFINNIPYLISDTSYLYIYTHNTIRKEYKQSGPTRRVKEIPITYYYFSFGEHKKIYSLTLLNIYRYVLTDSNLHSAVSKKFYTNEMLYEINPNTGCFVLNETLLISVKK